MKVSRNITLMMIFLLGNLVTNGSLVQASSFAEQTSESIVAIAEQYEDHPKLTRSFLIKANSQFIFSPIPGCSEKEEGKAQFGVLLVHDLYSSPYVFQHLARELSKNCALVYGLRLKGHGTVIDDLNYVQVEEWRRQIAAATAELKTKASKVIFIGAGLGAHLTVEHLLNNKASADGLVTFSFSLADCGVAKQSWQQQASQWGKIEEEIADETKLTSDLLAYSGESENGKQQASLVLSSICWAVKKGKRLLVPSLFVYGDRTFIVNKHRLSRIVRSRTPSRILFFHNARRPQDYNLRTSSIKLAVQDLSRRGDLLKLVPDEFLMIPSYDSWYGKDRAYTRCLFANSKQTRQAFCQKRWQEPSLGVVRGYEYLTVRYQTYNHGFDRLVKAINALAQEVITE